MSSSGLALGRDGSGAASPARPTASHPPSRLRRWLEPPRRLRITALGWVYILVTLGVGAAAVNTGNNLLFLVLGLMLGLIVVSGVMSEATLRHVRVERRPPARAHAGAPTLVEVTLVNDKRLLPSFSVELEDLLEGWSTDRRCYFLKVGPGGRQTAAYGTAFPARGAVRFRACRVATRYPFGLFEKWRVVELAGELVVYPALVEPPAVERTGRLVGGEVARRRPGLGDELHGLRDLRPGDELRSVHWRTTARRGRLIVREREEEAALRLAIHLDNARSPGSAADGPDPVVERAISLAASLAIDRAARGQAVDLAVRGGLGPRVQPGGSPDRLLRFLALLDYAPAEDPPPFGALPPGDAVLLAHPARASSFEGAVIAVTSGERP